ncbi:PH domain-containing protein [Neorhodopirellula pilleata]|uniref:Uncharacterized protein YyaB-like PH domain-containing protein n=1 Tax=Neorhodopirellula pilleata TaxID=2714738 RepID=A0A5C6A245_9BACT|nr:PH domain-containing protein [Neorhodopirellula pilleata]TWT93619.1 hypothetical protein Pla100_41370 [Neorhodopirellula pilleata]
MKENAANPLSRKTYRSAVDRWLAFLLLLPIVGAAAIGVVLVAMQRPGDAWPMFGVAVGTLLMTAIFTVPCRYTLLEDSLSVRCGVICYQIPYADIVEIRSAFTFASGPALSLRRVIVRTAKRDHILSPAGRESFMEDLQARLPDRPRN